jgi:predicted GNAT family acetyltransferase
MTITNNTSLSRYERVESGHTSYADYHIFDGIVSINYVFSPPELRGTGAAGRLMEDIMSDIRDQDLKVRPICGYAATWLKRHSEYDDLAG